MISPIALPTRFILYPRRYISTTIKKINIVIKNAKYILNEYIILKTIEHIKVNMIRNQIYLQL